MEKTKCPLFDRCNAPICPMENEASGIWFPDEAICKNKDFRKSIIIKNQHSIKKLKPKNNILFTIKMLSIDIFIRKDLEGLSIKTFNKEEERRWIEKEKRMKKDRIKRLKRRAKQILKEVSK